MDHNDPLYSDGLIKLRTLKTLYDNSKDLPRQENVVEAVQKDPPTREAGLIEKCADRAFAEYQEHRELSAGMRESAGKGDFQR